MKIPRGLNASRLLFIEGNSTSGDHVESPRRSRSWCVRYRSGSTSRGSARCAADWEERSRDGQSARQFNRRGVGKFARGNWRLGGRRQQSAAGQIDERRWRFRRSRVEHRERDSRRCGHALTQILPHQDTECAHAVHRQCAHHDDGETAVANLLIC
jgi:hypothetical protein